MLVNDSPNNHSVGSRIVSSVLDSVIESGYKRLRSWQENSTYARCGARQEDKSTKIGSALVAQGTGGDHESTNTVGLSNATDNGGTPCCGGTGGLLGLDELFLGVGGLGTMVGVSEERAKDGERCGVGEDGTGSDGRGLHGWEICRGRNQCLL